MHFGCKWIVCLLYLPSAALQREREGKLEGEERQQLSEFRVLVSPWEDELKDKEAEHRTWGWGLSPDSHSCHCAKLNAFVPSHPCWNAGKQWSFHCQNRSPLCQASCLPSLQQETEVVPSLSLSFSSATQALIAGSHSLVAFSDSAVLCP